MIKCSNCGVYINQKTSVCPLCHAKVTGNNLPEVFPPKKQRADKPILSASVIYLLTAVAIFAIAIAVNYLTDKTILWCYIIGAALFYGFFLVNAIADGRGSFSVKLFFNVAALALSLYFVSLITESEYIMVNYLIPSVFSVGIITQVIFLISTLNKYRAHFISTLLISLSGYIPLIMYGAHSVNELIPSLVTGIIASISIIATIAIGNKSIIHEAKKKFHI